MIKITDLIVKKIIKNEFISIKIIVVLNNKFVGISLMPIESDIIYNNFYIKNIFNSLNLKASMCIKFIKNVIYNNIVGKDPSLQYEIDNLLFLINKKFDNLFFKKIILTVSISIARSYSNYKKIKLHELISELSNNNNNKKPNLILNIFNKNNKNILCNYLDIKNFMLELNSNIFLLENLYYINLIYKKLINKLNKIYNKYLNINNKINSNIILYEINDLIYKSVLYNNNNINIGIDLSASDLYNEHNDFYFLNEKNKVISNCEFIEYIENLLNMYSISYIENSSHKYDWKLSYIQTEIFGNKLKLVGDSIFNNDLFLIEQGIKHNICNSILIKYYNMSTFSEIINICNLVKKYNYKIIISNIFRDIDDLFFIDLALGISSDYIKIGYIYNFNLYKNLILNK
ncbi:hypothetical protein [endosymbiont of Pachyrhynchus infernalis]|uniref:hypothetical protein n=1 Tax=endosymbiont of Pachyrhynchus infernalis TaxID=1971488 RepID=UPI000DC6E24C|nr:hypothetical protein [endosymbiont of Pachyrhynchus infernalis]BBA84815.1 phosphopyruvate hydratase [endosymbiont of Pachyrhynchus infernalis]